MDYCTDCGCGVLVHRLLQGVDRFADLHIAAGNCCRGIERVRHALGHRG
jgi:hypothetical protein